MTEKNRIGILISKIGSNMNAIVNACQAGYVSADVAFVGSDNPNAAGLIWAESQEIPTFVVDFLQIHEDFLKNKLRDLPSDQFVGTVYTKSVFVHNWFAGNMKKQFEYLRCKIVAEDQLLTKIKEYKIDLLVLAGYMQVCTSHFIDEVNHGDDDPRIMNIHPALLPAFPGTDGYSDTMNYGSKVGGCTVHFVDYDEDTGPIIGQRGFPILEGWDLDTLKGFGLTQEWELYPYCIQLFAQGRLKIVKQKYRGKDRKVVKILEEREVK